MAAGGFTLALVRLIANWSMSRSETTPPNSVGRLSSLAPIRGPTVAVELTDCCLGAAPMPSETLHLLYGSAVPPIRGTELSRVLRRLLRRGLLIDRRGLVAIVPPGLRDAARVPRFGRGP